MDLQIANQNINIPTKCKNNKNNPHKPIPFYDAFNLVGMFIILQSVRAERL